LLKMFNESPTTIYRAIDGFVSAGLVEKRSESDAVTWNLTPLGRKFVNLLGSLYNEKDELIDLIDDSFVDEKREEMLISVVSGAKDIIW
jgi:DNA-binding MarR family transcriptional regulator